MLSTAFRCARVLALVALTLSTAGPAGRAATTQPCAGTETWTKVGEDVFRLQGLQRSQGVTSDGKSWFFSWQGGVSRTDDRYFMRAINTIPLDILLQPEVHADGTNHIGGNHIGDIDVHGGLLYAPIEDGGESLGPIRLNEPEYQRPYIALYDAKTLLYSGVKYLLPLELHEAGVPWVAINHEKEEVYTAEWDMHHDRINVTDLHMNFLRFIDLHYPASLGPDFRLKRIQGAKVFGDALYASRDDDGKSVFKIDIATGNVSKVFSLDPGVPSELEGIAIRPTADGALLHLLIVLDNDTSDPMDAIHLRIGFEHFALACS